MALNWKTVSVTILIVTGNMVFTTNNKNIYWIAPWRYLFLFVLHRENLGDLGKTSNS